MLHFAIRNRIGHLLLGVVLLILSAHAASAGPFIYALNQVNGGANKIYGFSVNPTTGALTLLPGFPVASGGIGGPSGFSEYMAFAHGRLHVVNEGNATLSVFSVNGATGQLTAMPYSPIALFGNLACVAVHPSGSPIVVGTDNSAVSIVVTATTATPAAGSPFATVGANPFSCAMSADGSSFYTGGNIGTAIAGFSVAPSTGLLTALPGSPFETGAYNPVGYATDAAGRLFVSNYSLLAADVRAFTTSGGVPSAVSGNPFASGLSGAIHGIRHPGGFYMVADRIGNRVGVFRIAGSGTATTLTAVSGSPFATTGTYSNVITATPDGGLVVTANAVSHNLTVFRVDAATGSLTRLVVQPVNSIGTSDLDLITGLAFASFTSAPGDFDGDGTADVTVYRPSTGGWFTLNSSSNFTTSSARTFGLSTDTVVPGDYDGDGKVDNAIFRPSNGLWAVLNSGTNFTTSFSTTWGTGADTPVPADYDGDGRTDIAVFRPSTGQWFILTSSSNYTASLTFSWGAGGDVPVPADFDGDGRADLAVFRASTGQWFVLMSSTSYTAFTTTAWGSSADIAVSGDYDGDGKADPAVYRPSTGQWFLLNSSTGYGTFSTISWGTGSDVPVPGNYDGDRKTDPAIYRPSTGTWFVLKSSSNYTTIFSAPWGVGTDTPILKRP